jgi:hypothetical protein
MYWVRRATVLVAVFLSLSFLAWYAPRALDPTKKGPEKRAEDRLWVNSSPYFWDRQACRWISLCGIHHLRSDPAARGSGHDEDDDDEWRDLRKRSAEPRPWESEDQPRVDRKRNPHERRKVLKEIPDYVIRHAPLVHLYSGEQFWPSDIRDHVEHMTAYVDDEMLNSTDAWSLHNLHKLNRHEGLVVLQSNDNVESRPEWLHSHSNKPMPFPEDDNEPDYQPPQRRPADDWIPRQRKINGGYHTEPTTWHDVDRDHPLHRIADPRWRKGQPRFDHPKPPLSPFGHKPDDQGYSKAPAVLILVDKGSGVVDAFWFFFYSYNLGQTVAGLRFGNHVGDWEHCMVRFEHGAPRGIFFSEHEGGQAYAWQAVEKRGDRPVIYSAVGSHAMYALPGVHPYILPFKLLKDVTDKGPLWDPALNKYAYHYDYTLEDSDDVGDEDGVAADSEPRSLTPAAKNPAAPTSWFHYGGQWGDQVYSLADPRQWRIFGQYHYVTGPNGPRFKTLKRSKLCQLETCRIAYKLDPKATWY